MAKLVVLTEGLTGRSHELTAEKTTIGRVDDNQFVLPEPSVSSHHCEVLVRGGEVVVRDLNSTNGTFINNEPITEAPLKPGQILRLGKVELRLEAAAGEPAAAPPQPVATPAAASAPTAGAPAPAAPGAKKSTDHTMVLPRGGVSMEQLEQGPVAGGFDTASKGFSKKEDKVNKLFIIGGIIFGVVIVALFIYIVILVTKSG